MRLLPLSNPPAQRVVWGEEAMLERLARHRARRLGGEPALDLLPLVGMAVRRHHRFTGSLITSVVMGQMKSAGGGSSSLGGTSDMAPPKEFRFG